MIVDSTFGLHCQRMQAHVQGTLALFRLRTAAVDVEQKVEV
jgi:hypothetical protein